jgi:hypothetical protein
MAKVGKLWRPSAKDRKTVKAMAAAGISQNEIAAVLGITKPTLEKRLRAELDTGAAEATLKVSRSMLGMATRGPYSMVRYHAAAYWLTYRAGWKQTSVVEVNKLARDMTTEELRELIAANEADFRERRQLAVLGGDTVVPFTGPR